MAEFLEEYLRIGLSQVVVIDHRHSEERSGYQNEHTHETIVAYDGNRFVRVEASESRIFAPPGGHEFGLSSPEEITEAEYKQLTKGQERSDTPSALKALADRKASQEHQKQASEQLHAITPKCPKCGQPLTYRNGPRGRFWGCKSYPACNGTASFTAEHTRLFEIAARFV
jgi:topoisomerase-like DNA binding C4 zinc finger protein